MRFPLPDCINFTSDEWGDYFFIITSDYLTPFVYRYQQAHFNLIELLNLWPIQSLNYFNMGYFHHFIAGCRHLLLDMLIGNDLIVARLTSKTVLIISFF